MQRRPLAVPSYETLHKQLTMLITQRDRMAAQLPAAAAPAAPAAPAAAPPPAVPGLDASLAELQRLQQLTLEHFALQQQQQQRTQQQQHPPQQQPWACQACAQPLNQAARDFFTMPGCGHTYHGLVRGRLRSRRVAG